MKRSELKKVIERKLLTMSVEKALSLIPRSVGENVSKARIAAALENQPLNFYPGSTLGMATMAILEGIENPDSVSEDNIRDAIEDDAFSSQVTDEIGVQMGRLAQTAYSTLKDVVAPAVESMVSDIEARSSASAVLSEMDTPKDVVFTNLGVLSNNRAMSAVRAICSDKAKGILSEGRAVYPFQANTLINLSDEADFTPESIEADDSLGEEENEFIGYMKSEIGSRNLSRSIESGLRSASGFIAATEKLSGLYKAGISLSAKHPESVGIANLFNRVCLLLGAAHIVNQTMYSDTAIYQIQPTVVCNRMIAEGGMDGTTVSSEELSGISSYMEGHSMSMPATGIAAKQLPGMLSKSVEWNSKVSTESLKNYEIAERQAIRRSTKQALESFSLKLFPAVESVNGLPGEVQKRIDGASMRADRSQHPLPDTLTQYIMESFGDRSLGRLQAKLKVAYTKLAEAGDRSKAAVQNANVDAISSFLADSVAELSAAPQ